MILRRLIEARACELLPEGWRALAVTGSVGRGDATATSDVDVWAIVPERGPPLGRALDGVPITIFREDEAQLRSLEHLAPIEALDLYVIDDSEGCLARMQALVRDNAAALRRYNLENAVVFAAKLLAMSQRGSATGRAWALRKAAHRVAAACAYALTGRTAPKLRHLASVLPEDRFAALRRAHGLDELRPHAQELARLGAEVGPAVDALLHRHGVLLPRTATPAAALRKLSGAADDVDEGVLFLRTFLQRHVVDPLFAATRAPDLVTLLQREAPAPLARLFALLVLVDDAELSRVQQAYDELHQGAPPLLEPLLRDAWPDLARPMAPDASGR